MEQQVHENQLKNSKKIRTEFLSKFISFERKIGIQKTKSGGISLILNLLTILHSLFGYFLISDHPYRQFAQGIVNFFQSQPSLLFGTQIMVYFISIGLSSSFFFVTLLQNEGLWHNFFKNIIGNIPVLSKATLFLSAFLMYANFLQNILSMMISSLGFLGGVVLLGNYLLKKDENYQTCILQSLLFNLAMITNLFVNSFAVYSNSGTFFYVWSIFFGMLVVICYTRSWYNLFHNKFMSFIFRIYLALVASLSAEFAILLIRMSIDMMELDFVQWAFAFVILLTYFQIYANFQTLQVGTLNKYIRSGRVKQLQLNIGQALEELQSKNENLGLITGILDEHSHTECPNQKCWLKRRNLLDAIYSLSFSEGSFVKQKDSICKYFIRCAYQRVIKSDKSLNNILNYCEFITSEFQDFSNNCLYLQQFSSKRSLGFLQELRVLKLKNVMKEHSTKFNKQLFGGKFELLDILESESTYDNIFVQIKMFCLQNLHIWTELNQAAVNLVEIKQSFKQNYKLIEEINLKWKKLSKFFSIKKEWLHSYLLYTCYIKNEKIKNMFKVFQEQVFAQDSEDDDFSQSFDEQQPEKMKPSLFFHKQSAIIITVLKNSQLHFFRTSQSFNSLTLYKEDEVKDTPLNIILPNELQATHDAMFLEKLKEGKLNIQSQYTVKNTYFLNKKQHKKPCIVLFKLYVEFDLSDDFCKFVAFIKRDQTQIAQKSIVTFHNKIPNVRSQRSFNAKFNRSSGILKDSILTLDNQQNIFLKEEDLQPIKVNEEVINIGWVFRLFTSLLIIMIALSCFCIYKQMDTQTQIAVTWNYFLGLYRYPMSLIKNFFKLSLKIGSFSQTKNNIDAAFANLSAIMGSPQALNVIFNNMIPQQTEYPPYFNSTFNQDLAYDHFDIFYMVMQSLVTLSNSPSINLTGYDFMQIHAYLKPSYDNMMNSTKLNFHYSLVHEFKTTILSQKLFLVVIIIVSCTLFIWFYCKLRKHCLNMDEVFKIIINFSPSYNRKILNYWGKLLEGFVQQQTKCKLSPKSSDEISLAYLASQPICDNNSGLALIPNNSDMNLTKKQKVIVTSAKKQNKYFIVKVTIFLVMILEIMPVLSLIIYNLVFCLKLPALEDAGFQIFKYYPTNTIVGYALSDRYYSYVRPNQYTYNPDNFRDIVSNLKIISDTDYLVRGDPNSLFNLKLKNYFFGNPCTYNPAVLVTASSNLAKCIGYSNQTLTSGIIPYFRYVTPQIRDYVEGKVNYSATQMDTLTSGVALAGYYIIDIIQTWTDEFTGQLSSLQEVNIGYLTFISLILLLLHFIVFECWLFNWLKNDDKIVKKIFNHMVPQEILVHEKIIKQQFCNTGIIGTS